MDKEYERGSISRRSLLKMGGIAAVGALGASTLAACAPKGRGTDSGFWKRFIAVTRQRERA